MNDTKKRLDRIEDRLPIPKSQAVVVYRFADGSDEETAKAEAVKAWVRAEGRKLPASVRYIAVRIVRGRE